MAEIPRNLKRAQTTLLLDSSKPRRCVIYGRVSTSDQFAENQFFQLREFASRQGWEVVDVIPDVASGGKSIKERDGLAKIFEMGHQRRADILLFWSLDRFSREGSRTTIAYLTRLEGDGMDWHSYTEPYLSSLGVFKDCIIALLSALAKQEKVRIGERTRAGLERTRRINGTRLGRPKTDEVRIRQAVELRAKGLPFSEIGKAMGITRSRAHQLMMLAATTEPSPTT
jgi:putative DNA-invertase from lambdoid prophage Rac